MQLTSIVFLSLLHVAFAAPATEAHDSSTSDRLQTRDDYGSSYSGSYGGGSRYNDGSLYDGKYQGGSQYDGSSYREKYKGSYQYDDGSWYPGKYPDGSQYDDGSWYPGKYDHYGYDKHNYYQGGGGYGGHGGYGGYSDKCSSRKDAVAFQQSRYPDGIGASSTIGYFFHSQVDGAIPLYVAYKEETKDVFYTTDGDRKRRIVSEEKYVDKGIIGYVYPSGKCGCSPLYKLYNSKSYRHFYTTSWEEKEKAVQIGYEYRGEEGYVYKQ